MCDPKNYQNRNQRKKKICKKKIHKAILLVLPFGKIILQHDYRTMLHFCAGTFLIEVGKPLFSFFEKGTQCVKRIKNAYVNTKFCDCFY